MARPTDFIPEQSYYRVDDSSELLRIYGKYLQKKPVHGIDRALRRGSPQSKENVFPMYIIRTSKRYNICDKHAWDMDKELKYAKYQDYTNILKMYLAIKMLGN